MPEDQLGEIRTILTKSNLCRVIRVDGAWGGITPQQNIHLALFNERWKLADETRIRADESGELKDYPFEPELAIIREIEADVILSEEAAIVLRNWLADRIRELQVSKGTYVPPEQGK